MRIEVTEGHIREGQRCGCMTCPVALAVSDALSGNASAYKGGIIEVTFAANDHNRDPVMAVSTTEEDRRVLAEFIGRFDAGDPVAPFSFEGELQEAGE